MTIDFQTVEKEKAQVQANIQQLEQMINNLTNQLQQAQGNLMASRGAVLAYDRLTELSREPAVDVAALENAK
jgi:multidrug resistance efflux pump